MWTLEWITVFKTEPERIVNNCPVQNDYGENEIPELKGPLNLSYDIKKKHRLQNWPELSFDFSVSNCAHTQQSRSQEFGKKQLTNKNKSNG